MSRIVLVCGRRGRGFPFSARDIHLLATRLSPDNIAPRTPLVSESGGLLVGVVNPVDSVPLRGGSACMGAFIGDCSEWWKPGAAAPDGSYALFRSDAETVELLSDVVASRTIWYAMTEDLFIASTSQRAIVFFLRRFEPNPAAYPWMLSSGTLGPGLSWDRRIHPLPGAASLKLDRTSWTISIDESPIEFSPRRDVSDERHEARLREAIEDTFGHFDPDLEKWVLPLSGGVDSRAILLMLKDRGGLQTVTWGLAAARDDRAGDAYVAKTLAAALELDNRYFETDVSNEPARRILTRFLVAGEGRIDRISGYMDGFGVWKHLFEARYHGIIRGDEVFGCRAVTSDADVYRNTGMVVLSDFVNTCSLIGALGGCIQEIPSRLRPRSGESRETWRDRMNAEFEMPNVFAALNDLKLPYVEVVNPLLSHRIIQCVRRLPDRLRTEKRLFRRIVRSMGPSIGFAKSPSIASRSAALGTRPIEEAIRQRLGCHHTKEILPERLVDYVLATLEADATDMPAAHAWLGRADRVARRILRRKPLPALPSITLAFRLFIISGMTEMLYRDASAIRPSSGELSEGRP